MNRLLTLSITLLLLAGLTAPALAQDDDPLRIVATTTQAADLLNILGGDHIEVIGLMGPGVDPHLYQPTESDIAAMNQADAVLYSGLHLEGQFDTVFEGLGERDILTYAIARPVDQAGFVFNNFNGPTRRAWAQPTRISGLIRVTGSWSSWIRRNCSASLTPTMPTTTSPMRRLTSPS